MSKNDKIDHLIEVSIIGTEELKDVKNQPYTKYIFKLKRDTLIWRISKRYSDFDNLNKILIQDNDNQEDIIYFSSILPSLPSKQLLPVFSLSIDAINTRKLKLLEYIKSLVSCVNNSSTPNFQILSFLGLLDTSSYDMSEQGNISRSRIHLSRLLCQAKQGDLILFKCKNSYSKLQRTFTRSEWDHVGLGIVYLFIKFIIIINIV